MKKISANGFAISVDALLAILLTFSVLVFVGFEVRQPQSSLDYSKVSLKQSADDAFTALDNTGITVKMLIDQECGSPGDSPAECIKDEAEKLMPENTELHVKVTEYSPASDLTACRATKSFGDCFDIGSTVESGEAIPTDKEVMHGRKLEMMKNLGGTTSNVCKVISSLSEKKEEKPKAAFQDEEKIITMEIMVTDDSMNSLESLECCENPASPTAAEKAVVTMKLRDSSRDPIAIMLAMDRSLSMNTYDTLAQGETGSFNAGTCTGGAVCSTTTPNCPATNAEYTNWQSLATFQYNGSIANRMPPDIADCSTVEKRLDHFFSGQLNDSTTCGTIPKMKIVAPNGTTFYRQSSYSGSNYYPDYYTYMYSNHLAANDIAGQNWAIYGWSNKAYTSNVYRRFWGLYNAKNKLSPLSGGTGTGSGDECIPDTGTFKKIGEIELPAFQSGQTYYTLYAYMYYYGTYNNSVSGCRPRIYLKRAQGDGLDYTSLTVKCTDNTSCNVSYSGTIRAGKHEIWAWSDDPIDLTYVRLGFYYYDNTMGGYKMLPNVTVDCSANGCNGVACSTGSTNCGTKTNWLDNVQAGGGDIDYFSVGTGDHYLGVQARITQTGYAGVCSTPSFRIRKADNSLVGPWNGNGTQTITGTPLATGNYELEGWSDESINFAANWYLQRIDSSKKAAKNFIDNAEWQAKDQIGLVSFSTTSNLDKELTYVDEKETVKTALNGLIPAGQTSIASAINESAAALMDKDEATAGKFLVLLTDGKANICPSNPGCTELQAANDAISAADSARDEDITIYVIGFADSSIIGAYEDYLRQIAKHDDTNPALDECEVSDQYCGKYYFAANADVLDEVYEEIAAEIKTKFGTVEIKVPFPEGMQLENESNPGKYGIWNDSTGTLAEEGDLLWNIAERSVYLPENVTINYLGDEWFAMQFEAILPCSGSYCELDYVVFPPADTSITETITPGSPLDWAYTVAEGEEYCDERETAGDDCESPLRDKFLWLPFKYRDLKISFTGGTIGTDWLNLDLKVENTGYKDLDVVIDPHLEITFREKGETDLLGVDCDSAEIAGIGDEFDDTMMPTLGCDADHLFVEDVYLCKTKPESGTCMATPGRVTGFSLTNISVSEGGTIITEINPTLAECSRNNESYIYCGTEDIKYFTIDYYVWVK